MVERQKKQAYKNGAGLDISDVLLDITKITRGRIHRQQVFRDFVEYCALELSCRTDPVHMEARRKQQDSVMKGYTAQERELFMETFKQLTAATCRNLEQGKYVDLLGPIHQEFYPKSGPLKQDFTPPGVAQLLNRILLIGAQLPDKGYFTCNEPACGSGILCLKFAEELSHQGFNPCEQLVIQASDLDRHCIHMTYLQLSLYGIPAVIIHGDTISLQKFDRWYTPLYILRKWVWREPMPFSSGCNKSDELLKMLSEPWYAMARCIESLFSRKGDTGHEPSVDKLPPQVQCPGTEEAP